MLRAMPYYAPRFPPLPPSPSSPPACRQSEVGPGRAPGILERAAFNGVRDRWLWHLHLRCGRGQPLGAGVI
eukprot:scaffold18285_cov35-Tisochrysis_lutea.AAC.7